MLRERLINKLKSAGFKFKRDAWRVTYFKKAGTSIEVAVQKRDIIDDEVACSILRQAKIPQDEIAEFLRTCRN